MAKAKKKDKPSTTRKVEVKTKVLSLVDPATFEGDDFRKFQQIFLVC